MKIRSRSCCRHHCLRAAKGSLPERHSGGPGRVSPTVRCRSCPMEFDTGEGQRIRVVAVARASRVSLQRGVSSRRQHAGDRRARVNSGSSATACSIPSPSPEPRPRIGPLNPDCPARSTATWTSLSILSLPRIGFVYLTYTKPLDAQKRVVALARGKWDGNALTDVKDIFVSDIAGDLAHRLRPRRHALHDA